MHAPKKFTTMREKLHWWMYDGSSDKVHENCYKSEKCCVYARKPWKKAREKAVKYMKYEDLKPEEAFVRVYAHSKVIQSSVFAIINIISQIPNPKTSKKQEERKSVEVNWASDVYKTKKARLAHVNKFNTNIDELQAKAKDTLSKLAVMENAKEKKKGKEVKRNASNVSQKYVREETGTAKKNSIMDIGFPKIFDIFELMK